MFVQSGITGAFTGMRPGELRALRIDHVNMLARTVQIKDRSDNPSPREYLSMIGLTITSDPQDALGRFKQGELRCGGHGGSELRITVM